MACSFLKSGPKRNSRHIRTGTCDARVDMAQPKCSFWKRRNDPVALQLSLADRTDSFFAGIHREDVSSRRLPGKFLAAARILFTATRRAFARCSTDMVSRGECGRGEYCPEIDARTTRSGARFALCANDRHHDRLRLGKKIGAAVDRLVVFAARFLAGDAPGIPHDQAAMYHTDRSGGLAESRCGGFAPPNSTHPC